MAFDYLPTFQLFTVLQSTHILATFYHQQPADLLISLLTQLGYNDAFLHNLTNVELSALLLAIRECDPDFSFPPFVPPTFPHTPPCQFPDFPLYLPHLTRTPFPLINHAHHLISFILYTAWHTSVIQLARQATPPIPYITPILDHVLPPNYYDPPRHPSHMEHRIYHRVEDHFLGLAHHTSMTPHLLTMQYLARLGQPMTTTAPRPLSHHFWYITQTRLHNPHMPHILVGHRMRDFPTFDPLSTNPIRVLLRQETHARQDLLDAINYARFLLYASSSLSPYAHSYFHPPHHPPPYEPDCYYLSYNIPRPPDPFRPYQPPPPVLRPSLLRRITSTNTPPPSP